MADLPGDVAHAECTLGGAAQMVRAPAIALQDGIVDQRLQEAGAALSGVFISAKICLIRQIRGLSVPSPL